MDAPTTCRGWWNLEWVANPPWPNKSAERRSCVSQPVPLVPGTGYYSGSLHIRYLVSKMRPPVPYIIGKEILGHKIDSLLTGKGANCSIFKVADADGHFGNVLKACKDPYSAVEATRLKRENEILKILYTPATSKYFIKPLSDVVVIEGHHAFLMERAQSDLDAHLATMKANQEQEREDLFWDVNDAIEKAHELGVAHRDLHASNILMVQDGARLRAKIGDFGRARSVDLSSSTSVSLPVAFGAYIITPPEMLFGAIGDNPNIETYKKFDSYALGVIISWIFSGAPTNYFFQLSANISQFVTSEGHNIQDIPNLDSATRLELFKKWLRTNPEKLLAKLSISPQDKVRQDRLNKLIYGLCSPDPGARMPNASPLRV